MTTAMQTSFDLITPTDAMPIIFVNGELRGSIPGVEVVGSSITVSRDVTMAVFVDTVAGVSTLEISIRNGARLSLTVVSLASHPWHADIRLHDAGSSVEYAGLIFSEAGHTMHDVVISHLAPRTASAQLVRCIATGDGRIDWHGHVDVAHSAVGSTVRQDNKNVLLSERAKIAARPELDIEIDDVTASHGSATGRLDPEAMLYLTSRGIQMEEALLLLTLAFVEAALAQLPAHVRDLVITRFSDNIATV